MTQVKLLIIVTDDDERRRLLATWHDLLLGPRRPTPEATLRPPHADRGPVSFGRVEVREGLSLYLFIADGGWRREYVCRVLASGVSGYCLIVGPQARDVALGRDLLALLRQATPAPGLVALADDGDTTTLHRSLGLAADAPVPVVDCGERASIDELVCGLLERLAAVPAA